MYDEPLPTFSLARLSPFFSVGLFSHLRVSSHSLSSYRSHTHYILHAPYRSTDAGWSDDPTMMDDVAVIFSQLAD